MVTLTLQIKWFWLDQILRGTKKSEYRLVTDRLEKWLDKRGNPDLIKFTNGYRPNRPTVVIECKDVLVDEYEDEESGEEWEEYEFKLGKVLEYVDLPEGAEVNILKKPRAKK